MKAQTNVDTRAMGARPARQIQRPQSPAYTGSPDSPLVLPSLQPSFEASRAAPGAHLGYQLPSGGFAVSRSSERDGYPRVSIPAGLASPQTPWPGYRPTYYEAPVLDTKPPWADERLIDRKTMLDRRMLSGAPYTLVPLEKDGERVRAEQGRIVMVPENPYVRTGKTGRGELGKYGENWAGDLALLRYAPGQEPEGSEDGARVQRIFQGPCDDPRNTDNAWMMTTAFTALLTGAAAESTLEASDDADDARWVSLDEVEELDLFASHAEYIRDAVAAAPDDGRDKQILLILRGDGSGQWALPGGMADPGEAPIRTAVREAGEEAGEAIEEAVDALLAKREA